MSIQLDIINEACSALTFSTLDNLSDNTEEVRQYKSIFAAAFRKAMMTRKWFFARRTVELSSVANPPKNLVAPENNPVFFRQPTDTLRIVSVRDADAYGVCKCEYTYIEGYIILIGGHYNRYKDTNTILLSYIPLDYSIVYPPAFYNYLVALVKQGIASPILYDSQAAIAQEVAVMREAAEGEDDATSVSVIVQ